MDKSGTEAVGSYLLVVKTRTLGLAICFSTISKQGPFFASDSRVSSAWNMEEGSSSSCFGSGPL